MELIHGAFLIGVYCFSCFSRQFLFKVFPWVKSSKLQAGFQLALSPVR